MKPRRSPKDDPQTSMFAVRLPDLVDAGHHLAKLAVEIDWASLDAEVRPYFSDSDGAPAKPTRLMIGLYYLKRAYRLSDEETVRRWVENPYWQYFCGSKYFEYSSPVHPSLMTRWRAMLGDGELERLLEKAIPTAAHAVENDRTGGARAREENRIP